MSAKFIERYDLPFLRPHGELFQQGLFNLNGHKFKYCIKTNEYDFQSYARLYCWTNEKGFEIVISKQLKEHYGKNPTHTYPQLEKQFFDSIIEDLVKIADEFSDLN